MIVDEETKMFVLNKYESRGHWSKRMCIWNNVTLGILQNTLGDYEKSFTINQNAG